MNVIILLRLICAHLLADFPLQPDFICEGKKADGLKGLCYSLLHSFIHALLAYLFVAQWTNWIIPLAIFCTHFGVDWYKARRMNDTLRDFLLDQILHFAVILILWACLFTEIPTWMEILERWNTPRFWLIFTAYLFVLQPSSLLLGKFIGKWTPEEMKNRGLPNAGKWIGYLERILILTFILTGNMGGVGFLLAAKSIFRFGELSKTQDIRTTEYVLIGTLASFSIATIIGLAVANLM